MNEVSTTTRTSGCSLRSRRVVSTPSSTGIERSISTTSGRRSWARTSACCPSDAWPTTSRSAAVPIKATRPARTRWWSSTSSTVVLVGGDGVCGSATPVRFGGGASAGASTGPPPSAPNSSILKRLSGEGNWPLVLVPAPPPSDTAGLDRDPLARLLARTSELLSRAFPGGAERVRPPDQLVEQDRQPCVQRAEDLVGIRPRLVQGPHHLGQDVHRVPQRRQLELLRHQPELLDGPGPSDVAPTHERDRLP